MTPAVVPPGMEGFLTHWRMSPGLAEGGFLFLSGMTAAEGGTADPDPARQIETAFAKVEAVLAQAGLDFGAVVEMTSFHIGLRDHLPAMRAAWEARVRPPFPAWTAVEVAGLVTPGCVVELRVIARLPQPV